MTRFGLRALLRSALGVDLASLGDTPVMGVAQRADRVEAGFVFVARVGAGHDGHDFIPEAIARGAIAIVGARGGHGWGVPYVRVADDRWATSALSAAVHDFPDRALRVVAVTGTDGKTTTATLTHHLLQGGSETPVASLLSSAGVRIGGAFSFPDGHFTTPEAPEVQAHLAAARAAGVRVAVIEASSHAAALQRVAHVHFDAIAWTNLTPEHLDFHGSFEAYRAAKGSLIARAGVAILNRDDGAYADFALLAQRSVSYGVDAAADVRCEGIRSLPGALAFEVLRGAERMPALLPMVGGYNVHNALAALLLAEAAGVPLAEGIARLASFAGVPGRMQVIARAPWTLVVDFAHTAPALAKALAALSPAPGGRRIVVIGAAGERDPGKRAPLGAVAVSAADVAVLTEEDHRSEDLAAILAAMREGARAAGGVEGESFFVEGDRRAAIARAIALAQPGDVVLLAGKGHERTLERGGVTLPWDEAEEARQAHAAASGRVAS
jgi:UDP-N-acetylmuramoyl-L-alanyl-D-glutamate--2,6-diaminopimelate ligase